MSRRFVTSVLMMHAPGLAALTAPGPAMASAYEVGDTDIGAGWKVKLQVARLRSGDELGWSHPELEVGWGFADSLELAVGTGYGRIETTGGPRRHGHHDARVALKWGIRQESPGTVGIAFEPDVTLPTGDRAAGTGGDGVELALPMRISQSFGRGRLTALFAYLHAFADDARMLSLGVLYEHEVATGLWAGAEVLHDHGLGEQDDRERRMAVGLRWQRSERWMLFGGYGKGLYPGDAGDSSSARIGIEYVFD